jgi:hypothetical protein
MEGSKKELKLRKQKIRKYIELVDFRGDIRRILNTSPGATAATRLILRTKLLD